MSVLKADLEHRVWQRVNDLRLQDNFVFFRQWSLRNRSKHRHHSQPGQWKSAIVAACFPVSPSVINENEQADAVARFHRDGLFPTLMLPDFDSQFTHLCYYLRFTVAARRRGDNHYD